MLKTMYYPIDNSILCDLSLVYSNSCSNSSKTKKGKWLGTSLLSDVGNQYI